jgi:tetratricopeptide (TPR) repeat protein
MAVPSSPFQEDVLMEAGWRDDPSGRHQHRYWGGTSWTEHIANDGTAGTDANLRHTGHFDGVAGRTAVEYGSSDLLTNLAHQAYDPALTVAQMIAETVPAEPAVTGRPGRLDDVWRWINAVAQAASAEGRLDVVGRIGLMTEVWNRHILVQDPGLMMGRLPKVPVDIELDLYEVSLEALHRLPSTQQLVSGPQGWSVVEACEQISITVQQIADADGRVPARTRKLASGDPDVIDALKPPRELDAGAVIDRMNADMEGDDEAKALFAAAATMHAIAKTDYQGWAARKEARGESVGTLTDAQAMFDRSYELLQDAARLGHVEAMNEVAVEAERRGDQATQRFWAETAARAGSSLGMYNLGVLESQVGNAQEAGRWFLQAAEAGKVDGYAALLELADRAGDESAAGRWAKLGAGVDQPYCLQAHGFRLFEAGDHAGGIAAAERGAEYGDRQAMFAAGRMQVEVGNGNRARYWLIKARAAGHPRAQEIIDRFELE